MQKKYVKGIIASIVIFGLSAVLMGLSDVYAPYDTHEILIGIVYIGAMVAPILFAVSLVKGLKSCFKTKKGNEARVKPPVYRIPIADYSAIDKEYRKMSPSNVITDDGYHEPDAARFTLLSTTATPDQNDSCVYYYEIQISKTDGTLYFVRTERIDSGKETGLVKCNAFPIGYDDFNRLCSFLKKPSKELASLNETNWQQFLAKHGIFGKAVYLHVEKCIGEEISRSSFGQSSSYYRYKDNGQNNYIIEYSHGNHGFGIFVYGFEKEKTPSNLDKLKKTIHYDSPEMRYEETYIIKMDKADYLKKLPNLPDYCFACHKKLSADVYYYDRELYCSACFVEKCKIDEADEVFVINAKSGLAL